jgi:hypothetical protein
VAEENEEEEEFLRKLRMEASFVYFKICWICRIQSHDTAAEVTDLHIILNTFYQKMKQADLRDKFKKASKTVSTSPFVVSPDPLSPTTSRI